MCSGVNDCSVPPAVTLTASHHLHITTTRYFSFGANLAQMSMTISALSYASWLTSTMASEPKRLKLAQSSGTCDDDDKDQTALFGQVDGIRNRTLKPKHRSQLARGAPRQ